MRASQVHWPHWTGHILSEPWCIYTRKNHINHSNQLRLSHYMAFTYLDWFSRKKTETRTGSRDVLNTTELDSVHALQYICMFPTLVKTNFYSELLRYNSIFNCQEVFRNLFFCKNFLPQAYHTTNHFFHCSSN